jgi:toxin FitB
VLSAGSPATRAAQGPLQAWMDRNSARLFVPSIAVAEIVGGIESARRAGAVRKAAALDDWLGETIRLYAGRVLPLDEPAARMTGTLIARARALGQGPGFADLAIAGIAMAHGLTVLTRNLRHFAPLGVPAQDPYAALPG